MKRFDFWKGLGAALIMTSILSFAGCGAGERQQEHTAAPTQADEAAVAVELDMEKDVLYFGRTYEKGDVHWFNWSGSGFSIRFKGSAVAAEFCSNAPQVRDWAYLKVYVDGVEQEDVLLRETNQVVMLAEGLDGTKEHTVRVLKRTNVRSSTAGVGRIVLMDGTVLEPEEPKQRLIEFLGDSLTVGYVASKEGKTATAWSTTTEDVTGTYCPQIAAALDADYQVVAVSGRGVVRNNGGDGTGVFPDIYRELDYYNHSGTPYDFEKQPDVIVINLGTNDESNANQALPAEEFRQGLYAFLKEVRQYNPQAQILYTYGLVRIGLAEDISQVISRLRDEGDEKIHYLRLEQCQKWELNLNHTVSTAYTSRGDAIIQKIREITGW